MSIKLECIKHSDSAQLLLSAECAAIFSSGTLLIHSSSCCCPPLPLLPSHFSLWCFSWEGCAWDAAERLTPSTTPPIMKIGKSHKCVMLLATNEIKFFFRWIVFSVYQVCDPKSIQANGNCSAWSTGIRWTANQRWTNWLQWEQCGSREPWWGNKSFSLQHFCFHVEELVDGQKEATWKPQLCDHLALFQGYGAGAWPEGGQLCNSAVSQG